MNNADQPQGPDWARILRFLLALPTYFVLCMFWPAGSWNWGRGWLFVGVFVVTMIAAAVYLRRVNPEILVARTQRHAGTKRWDKILLGFFLAATYAIIPVAALDDGRFHGSRLPWWVCGLGYALFLLGMAIVTWAQSVNKFFEPTVRIQTDRGQTVIDRGPYAIVRHPGYVGGLLVAVGTALALGSLWALLPAGIAGVLLILRTRWEDRTLQAELPGYQEYTRRVRYRLLPGVW